MEEILVDLVNLSKKRSYKQYIILALQKSKNRKILRKCIDYYKHYGGGGTEHEKEYNILTEHEKEYNILQKEAERLRAVVQQKKDEADRAKRELNNQQVITNGLIEQLNIGLRTDFLPLNERRKLPNMAISVPEQDPDGHFERKSKAPEHYPEIYGPIYREASEQYNNQYKKMSSVPGPALSEFLEVVEDRRKAQRQMQNGNRRPLS